MQAKRNQVLLRVVAGVAAEFFVVDFEVGLRATQLRSETVATQHRVAELFVQFGIKPKRCGFGRTQFTTLSR